MSKLLWNVCKATSVLVGLLVSNSAVATPSDEMLLNPSEEKAFNEQSLNEFESPSLLAQSAPTSNVQASQSELTELLQRRHQLKRFNDSSQSEPMSQVTSVSELRDVSPTEWAYEALRSLVERYGCIVGYPDRTYRGTRALTRWEFAAGLNACMNTLERLIQENVGVLKEDVETLKRLAEEFQTELAALGTRVDNLEARTTFLEDNQFSTTTKLTGEAVVALYGVAAGERFDGEEDIDKVPALGDRVRLELNTSFTGEDLLFARLSTGNVSDLVEETGTFQSTLSFAQPEDNDFGLEVLFYNFPITENIGVWLEAAGGAFDDWTNTLNTLDGDGGYGALSAFGTRNSIYFLGDGAGVGLQGQFGAFEWSAGYLANEGNDPSEGSGLFNGPYGALAQIGYNPSETFGVALTYAHTYNSSDTGVGSRLSNFQSFTEDLLGEAVPTVSDSYALGFSWQVADGFIIGGWGTYGKVTTLSSLEGQIDRGSLDIWTWAATLAFPDFLKEGSTAGIIVGMQPWVADSSVDLPDDLRQEDEDTSLHIEAFYQYGLTDNIQITPGIIVITSPDYNNDNSTLVIGTIRTTFTF